MNQQKDDGLWSQGDRQRLASRTRERTMGRALSTVRSERNDWIPIGKYYDEATADDQGTMRLRDCRERTRATDENRVAMA